MSKMDMNEVQDVAFRGIELNMMNAIRHPMRTVEYVLIPLLFSTISVMEELAAAALARGMDAGVKRSSYEVVKLRTADYIVIAVFLCLIWYICIPESQESVL